MPPPRLPPFADRRARVVSAEYLSAATVRPGTEADAANAHQPDGWDFIIDPANFYSERGAWVRAHLLAARLGGNACGNNLVPARRMVNKALERGVEGPAHTVFKKRPVWYESRVEYGYENTFPGFPSYLRSTFGRYRHIGGSGAKRSDWTRTAAEKTLGLALQPPQPDEKGVLYINSYGQTLIKKGLGVSKWMASRIYRQRAKAGGAFQGYIHFRAEMNANRKALRNPTAAKIGEYTPMFRVVAVLVRQGKLSWLQLHENK